MNKSFIYLIILLLFQNCKKNELDQCKSIPDSKSPIGYSYLSEDVKYIFPTINPNNSNELLIYKVETGIAENELYLYDLETQEKHLIFTGNIYHEPHWDNENIILSVADGNIWKINAQTYDLVQITISANATESATNDNIIIYDKAGPLSPFYFINIDGVVIDSLDLPGGTNIEWGTNNKILISLYDGIILYDYTSKDIQYLNTSYNLTGSSRCEWVNDSEFIWVNKEAIYMTNILSQNTKIIKSFCDAMQYRSPNYSNVSKKLIFHKIVQKKVDDNVIQIENFLVSMNLDGTKETIIETK